MNRHSCRILCQALLLTSLYGLGHAAASADPEPVSRISVVFVKPEKFTDARRADFKPNSDAILDAIAKFMEEMGDETIPRDMNLDIKVTDIDLAGNFEPWHGPQSDQVRITRGLYPPRIALEFLVIGPRGQVIQTGKARDWNWHNVIGFWSSSVLVVLTLTAAVMSYPWANDLLYTLTGSEPPPRAQGPAGPPQRARRSPGNAEEQRIAKPMANLDALLTTAERQVPGWTMLMMRFPPRPDGPLIVSISELSAPHNFARSQLTLNRATAEVMKWEPYSENSLGRKLRSWFRGLHTGEAFGFFGQTIAGLASLGGCFLVWTGVAMAWRRFRSRGREIEESSVTQPVLSKDAASIEISLEGEKSSMELDILPGKSSQLGHSSDGNGTVAHRHATRGNYSGGNSVLILFGTVTGNAESLAQRTAKVITRRGFDVRVKDMAHCTADALSQESCVIIITSTYGNGEPPDDAAPFWEEVVQKDGLNLRGVKFSVLALGNSTYDHFCKCGRDLDAALERHGATRLYPRVDCDVDYDVPAKRWTEGVLASLPRDHGASAAA